MPPDLTDLTASALPLQPAPVAVALSAELPAAGDYLTLPSAEPGVLLVRQADRVAAFLNRCRHRRRPVVIEAHGDGARGFICPFHAWRYGLDGDLAYAPKHDWPEGDGWAGLHRLPVIEAGGLILAATAPDAPAAAIQRGPAGALQHLRSYGLDGLVRLTRGAVRTEISLARVMCLAASLVTDTVGKFAALIREPAALIMGPADAAERLVLIGPATLVALGGDAVMLVRAKALRRGGCEVQIVGFGRTADTPCPADKFTHALQEAQEEDSLGAKLDADLGANLGADLGAGLPAIAAAFAVPVA